MFLVHPHAIQRTTQKRIREYSYKETACLFYGLLKQLNSGFMEINTLQCATSHKWYIRGNTKQQTTLCSS